MPETISPDISEINQSPKRNDASSNNETGDVAENGSTLVARREINPTELQAQKVRAQVLRDYPAMRVLLEYVRGEPDLYQSLLEVVKRRQDFIGNSAAPGELHRGFAAMFAGLELDPRARNLLNEAIERTVATQSTWHKERIRSGDNYYSELVIGSGVHSAIYNAERMALDPSHPALTMERNQRIGGQFAQSIEETWKLNSRTRREDKDLDHLPGTAGSLNTLGKGTLQQADLTGQTYGPQSTLAEATRVDQLLSSQLMVNTDFYKIIRNPDSQQQGKYLVIIKDQETGQDLLLRTDRVIVAGGLGAEIPGLDPEDQPTRQILEEEAAKFKEKGQAQVLTFSQAAKTFGDPKNTFPLQDFENVGVVGAGDGGKVMVEALTGKIQLGKSVTSLDRVKSISWWGQKADTCQEFKDNTRIRYLENALEFPRQDNPDYPSRINPIDQRLKRLERNGDKIRAIWLDENGQEQSVELDHLILAVGFKDETDKTFASLNDETLTDAEVIKQRLPEILSLEGAILSVDDPFTNTIGFSIDSVQASDQDGTQIEISRLLNNGQKRSLGSFSLNSVVSQFTSSPAFVITAATVPGKIERVPYYPPDQEKETRTGNETLTNAQEIFNRRDEILLTPGAVITLKADAAIRARKVVIKSIDTSKSTENPKIIADFTFVNGVQSEDADTLQRDREYLFETIALIDQDVESVELPVSATANTIQSSTEQQTTPLPETTNQRELLTDPQEILDRRDQILRTPGAKINFKEGQTYLEAIVLDVRTSESNDGPEVFVEFNITNRNGGTFRDDDYLDELKDYYFEDINVIEGSIESVELPSSSTQREVTATLPSQQTAASQVNAQAETNTEAQFEAENNEETITDPTEIYDRASSILTMPGTIITFKSTSRFRLNQIKIIGLVPREDSANNPDIRVEFTNRVNDVTPDTVSLNDLRNNYLFTTTEINGNIASVKIPATAPESSATENANQNERLTNADEIFSRRNEILRTPGAVINLREGARSNLLQVKVLGIREDPDDPDESEVLTKYVYADGQIKDQDFTLEAELSDYFSSPDKVRNTIESIELTGTAAPQPETVSASQAETVTTGERLTNPEDIFDRARQILRTPGAVINLKPGARGQLAQVRVIRIETDPNYPDDPNIITQYEYRNGVVEDKSYSLDDEFFDYFESAETTRNTIESIELPGSNASQSQNRPENNLEVATNGEAITDPNELLNRSREILSTPGAIINFKPGARGELTQIKIVSISPDRFNSTDQRVTSDSIYDNGGQLRNTFGIELEVSDYFRTVENIERDIESVQLPATANQEPQSTAAEAQLAQPESQGNIETITNPVEIDNRRQEIFTIPGTIINYKPDGFGQLSRVKVLKVETGQNGAKNATVEITNQDGSQRVRTDRAAVLRVTYLSTITQNIAKEIASVELPAAQPEQSAETQPQPERGRVITDPTEIFNLRDQIAITPGAIIERSGASRYTRIKILDVSGPTESPVMSVEFTDRNGTVFTGIRAKSDIVSFLSRVDNITKSVDRVVLPEVTRQPEAATSTKVINDPNEIFSGRNEYFSTVGAIINVNDDNVAKVRVVGSDGTNITIERTFTNGSTNRDKLSPRAAASVYLGSPESVKSRKVTIELPAQTPANEAEQAAERVAQAEKFTDPQQIFELRDQILSIPGTIITFKGFQIAKREITKDDGDRVEYTNFYRDGTISQESFSKAVTLNFDFRNAERVAELIESVEIPARPSASPEQAEVNRSETLSDPNQILALRNKIANTPGAVVNYNDSRSNVKRQIVGIDGQTARIVDTLPNGSTVQGTVDVSDLIEGNFASTAIIRSLITSVELPAGNAAQNQPERLDQSNIIADQNEITKNRLEITQTPGAIISLSNGTLFEIVADQSLAANQVRYRNLANGRDLQPRNRTDFIRQFFDSGQVVQVELPTGVRLTGMPDLGQPNPESAPTQTQRTNETAPANVEVLRDDEIQSQLDRIVNTNGAEINYSDRGLEKRVRILTNPDDQRQGVVRYAQQFYFANDLGSPAVESKDDFITRFFGGSRAENILNVTIPAPEQEPPAPITEAVQGNAEVETIARDQVDAQVDRIIATPGARIVYKPGKVFREVVIQSTPDDVARNQVRFQVGFFNDPIPYQSVDQMTVLSNRQFRSGYLEGGSGSDIDRVEIPQGGPSETAATEAPNPSPRAEILRGSEIQSRLDTIANTNGAIIRYGGNANGDIIKVLTTPEDRTNGVVRFNLNTDSGISGGAPGTTRVRGKAQFISDFLGGLNGQLITSVELPPATSPQNESVPTPERSSQNVDTIRGAEIRRQLDRVLNTNGTVINYSDRAAARKVTIINSAQQGPRRNITFITTFKDGSESEAGTISDILFINRFLEDNGPGSPGAFVTTVEVPSSPNTEPVTAEAEPTQRTPETPTPRVEAEPRPRPVPIAAKYPNEEIYIIGPAAGLPLTQEERERSAALQDINENTAAIFRYADYTQRLARLLAQKDRQEQTPRTDIDQMRPKRIEHEQLPPLSRQADLGQTFSYQLDRSEIKGLPAKVNTTDLLRLVTSERLYPYRFPENLNQVTLNLQQNGTTEDAITFNASFTPNITTSPAYQQAFNRLLNDPAFKEIMVKMSQTYPNKGVRVTIPLEAGRVALHEISARPF